MARQLYLYRDGEWIEAEKAPPKYKTFLISDSLPDVWNPKTMKRYTSKSKYYRETREAGGEIVGNDRSIERREYKSTAGQNLGESLRRAWHQLGGD